MTGSRDLASLRMKEHSAPDLLGVRAAAPSSPSLAGGLSSIGGQERCSEQRLEQRLEHEPPVASGGTRGAVQAQCHRCHRCARVQASPWPSNLLSAFPGSLRLLSAGSPRTVPSRLPWCPPHPQHTSQGWREDFVPSREKPRQLLPHLPPLPSDPPCGLQAPTPGPEAQP